MSIAFLGTRGIPNTYGGFEQCAEFLSQGLIKKGHEVTVYCSSNQEFQKPFWNDVKLVHCSDPERMLGTAGQFIYDFNCIMHARRQHYDVIVQFGYTSSSIWQWLWPKQSHHLVNMDGLEFLRDKYGDITKRFLKWAEKWATLNASILIADNEGIKDYLESEYPTSKVKFISYGADIPSLVLNDQSILSIYDLKSNDFDLVICRMEPENSIETVLEAHTESACNRKLVVVGNTNNPFGKKLYERFNGPKVLFTQGIYDINALNVLRSNCYYYLHGHTVGGTNPSLLEAMVYAHRIVAHNNQFNRSVLKAGAQFFSDIISLKKVLSTTDSPSHLDANKSIIAKTHRWEFIVDQYESACYEVV